jgi:hypothetical protein
MHDLDDLTLFVSFFYSNMLGISNVVCYDRK